MTPPAPAELGEPGSVGPAGPVRPGGLNQSNFNPEFSGDVKEDAEAHLLSSNDWMNTDNLPETVKYQ